MKKQIIKIALYDGWKLGKDGWLYKGRRPMLVSEQLDYSTNLNELHRVAVSVWDKLHAIGADTDIIASALLCSPVRGRYTHLIKAVADGIDYLNTHRNA